MRPPPGVGSRKPSRSCNRRSCCGSSRSQADVIQHTGRCAVAMAAVSADPGPLLRRRREVSAPPGSPATALDERSRPTDQGRRGLGPGRCRLGRAASGRRDRAIRVSGHGPLRRVGTASARSTARRGRRPRADRASRRLDARPVDRQSVPDGFMPGAGVFKSIVIFGNRPRG